MSSYSSPPPGGQCRERGSLPSHISEVLRTWLQDHLDHPYPTEEEKQIMVGQTGLTINQISNWFINARRRNLEALRMARDDNFRHRYRDRSSINSDASSDEDQPLLMAPYQKHNSVLNLDDENFIVSAPSPPVSSAFPASYEHDNLLTVKPLPRSPPFSPAVSSYSNLSTITGTPSERDHILPDGIADQLTDHLEQRRIYTAPPCYGALQRPPTPIPAPGYHKQETYWDVISRRQRQHSRPLPAPQQPCGHRCVICEEQSLATGRSNRDSFCNEHCDTVAFALWKVLLIMALLAVLSMLLFCLAKLGTGILGIEP